MILDTSIIGPVRAHTVSSDFDIITRAIARIIVRLSSISFLKGSMGLIEFRLGHPDLIYQDE